MNQTEQNLNLFKFVSILPLGKLKNALQNRERYFAEQVVPGVSVAFYVFLCVFLRGPPVQVGLTMVLLLPVSQGTRCIATPVLECDKGSQDNPQPMQLVSALRGFCVSI